MDFIPQKGGPGSLLKEQWPLLRSCIVPASDKRTKCKMVFVELEENLSPLDIKPIMSFPSLSISHASRLRFFPQLAYSPIGQKNFITDLSHRIPEAQIGAEKRYYTWVQHYAKKTKSHLP